MNWLKNSALTLGGLLLIVITGCTATIDGIQPENAIEIREVSELERAKMEETMRKQYLGQQYTHLNIHDAYRPYPELVEPVRAVMRQNQLPGHDTEAIYFHMNDDKTDDKTIVTVTFIFAEGFVHPTYGPQAKERILVCHKEGNDEWACLEEEA